MSQLKSRAARAALDILSDPEASASTKMQASKYITSRGWDDQPSKGRPSKKDINKAAKQAAEESSWLDDDYTRITGAH